MLDLEGLANKALGKTASYLDAQFPSWGIAEKILGVKDNLMPNGGGFITPEGHHWAGLSKAEINAHYKNLHALGVQQKEYYIVRFKPFRNGILRNIPLIDNELSGWLATDVSWPVLQVKKKKKKAGNYNLNYATGRQAPEINITMIETSSALVMQSIMQMRNVMFPQDGTFGLPSDYSLWVEMYLYGRENGIAYPKTACRSLCYISQATLETSASDGGGLTVPLTFTTSRPFMNT